MRKRRKDNWYPPCTCLRHFHSKYGMWMHMKRMHRVRESGKE